MLIIVGSVLGGLLLISVIVLITVTVRSVCHLPIQDCSVTICTTLHSYRVKDTAHYICISDHFRLKKHPKASSTSDIGKPLIGSTFLHVNGSKGVLASVPKIPRATTHKSNSPNLEMMPSNSQQNLISASSNSVSVPPSSQPSRTVRTFEFSQIKNLFSF